jgi:3-hydroxyacyl-CoA dehydrogenase
MQISTIDVVGDGTMGSGIAQAAATKGLDVILMLTMRRSPKVTPLEPAAPGLSPKARCQQLKNCCARAHPRLHRLLGSQAGPMSSLKRPPRTTI